MFNNKFSVAAPFNKTKQKWVKNAENDKTYMVIEFVSHYPHLFVFFLPNNC